MKIMTKMKNFRTKKTSISIAILFVCMLTVVQFSCSKPENGTNGLDGKNGINGINGINGATGPTGTANVIYSNWANVTFQETSPRQVFISTPAITQDVLDKATVLVFFKTSTSNVLQLNYYENIGYGIFYMSNYLSLGRITVLSTFSFTSAPFRYIIIPGGTPAGRRASPAPNYKNMTYSQVCDQLNIPE